MNTQIIALNDQQLQSVNGGFLWTAAKAVGKHVVKPYLIAKGADSVLEKTLPTEKA